MTRRRSEEWPTPNVLATNCKCPGHSSCVMRLTFTATNRHLIFQCDIGETWSCRHLSMTSSHRIPYGLRRSILILPRRTRNAHKHESQQKNRHRHIPLATSPTPIRKMGSLRYISLTAVVNDCSVPRRLRGNLVPSSTRGSRDLARLLLTHKVVKRTKPTTDDSNSKMIKQWIGI